MVGAGDLEGLSRRTRRLEQDNYKVGVGELEGWAGKLEDWSRRTRRLEQEN